MIRSFVLIIVVDNSGDTTSVRKCFWFYSKQCKNKQNVFKTCTTRKASILMLLLICGDVEQCPGPHTINQTTDRMLHGKGMHILHQNIRGLFTNFSGLCEFFERNNTKIDILTLSETFITDHNNYDDLYKLPGYVLLQRNRTSGTGGGVAVYIRSGIELQRRFDLEMDKLKT